MRFLLASVSPRRAELLAAAGFAFEVVPPDVDESQREGEPPRAYVARVAALKAADVARRHPDCLVLGADTTVVLDGRILGKPVDAAEAGAMLRQLAGRTHEVLTGVTLRAGPHDVSSVEVTDVHLMPLGADEIARYVASGEPLDKAGAYAIQGRAARFVDHISGSYSNVVGLPIATVWRLLREMGFRDL